MGKKSANRGEEGPVAVARKGPEGGILYSAGDQILEATRQQARYTHITKPWTREAWEKARPWILEQRQKMEAQGWSPVDGARTELFVLRKPAPHGAETDDGFLYVRIPKKFIDFNRAGKSAADDDDDTASVKSTRRVSKKRENAPSHELAHTDVWRIRIDSDAENAENEANVQLDVIEPLENIFYLVMTLQPGLARLTATRKDVIQPGTKESDVRDDAEGQTIRHRAMVAATESYMRVVPPAYWYRRNETWLRKILSDATYETCVRAAEDNGRATTRTVKDVKEKVWEEKVKADEAVDKNGVRKSAVRKAPRFNALAAASCLGTAAA